MSHVRAAVALVAAGVLSAGAAVRADQTVHFDEAGDAPRISLIGDSTLTGVRWYADYGPLERFNFVFSAESCRRTVEQSCVSREGYRSENVVGAMRALDGELGELLVVMTGYNDPMWSIDESIAAVLAEAQDQGVPTVMWLTLRTNGVDYSDPQEYSSTETFREYNTQLVAAAAASGGFLQVADWARYSDGASDWFEADGVHLTATGVDALTAYLAEHIARVLAGEQISPAVPPWTVLVPGAGGDIVAAVQQALVAAGIDVGADGVYGNATMAAVAEFQRRTDGLQVTGAVDAATARALGVLPEPGDRPLVAALTDEPARVTTPTTVPVAGSAAPPLGGVPELSASAGSGAAGRRAAMAGVAVAAAALLGLVVRHRVGMRRRTQRRWARVHPATSPLRSVADMRRSGELPPVATGPRLYDHGLEDATGQ